MLLLIEYNTATIYRINRTHVIFVNNNYYNIIIDPFIKAPNIHVHVPSNIIRHSLALL